MHMHEGIHCFAPDCDCHSDEDQILNRPLITGVVRWCVQDLGRYAGMAYRSFATRFSSSYVDGLLRQAGTVDDMKMLAQHVHSLCRTRKDLQSAKSGQAADDEDIH